MNLQALKASCNPTPFGCESKAFAERYPAKHHRLFPPYYCKLHIKMQYRSNSIQGHDKKSWCPCCCGHDSEDKGNVVMFVRNKKWWLLTWQFNQTGSNSSWESIWSVSLFLGLCHQQTATNQRKRESEERTCSFKQGPGFVSRILIGGGIIVACRHLPGELFIQGQTQGSALPARFPFEDKELRIGNIQGLASICGTAKIGWHIFIKWYKQGYDQWYVV